MRTLETIRRDVIKQRDVCTREQTKLEVLRREYDEAVKAFDPFGEI